jgi:hypothetical protein
MAKKNTEPIIYEGDVYRFPVNKKYGLIQIIKIPDESTLTVIVFEKLFNHEEININNLDKEKILLFGTTYDGRIYNDIWLHVGRNTENIKSVKYPYYKIGFEDDGRIEDYDENYIRNTTKYEFLKLEYRDITDPLPFEKMLKKYHGLLDQDYDYEDSLYSYVLESIKIVEGKK